MARLREIWARLRGTVSRGSLERDMDEEFRFPLEQATAGKVLRGLEPEAARREALAALGGVERHEEEVRDARRSRYLEAAVQDARYGARSLGRNPGFAIAAVLTMALGIGANTGMFSVVNGVLLRPLPFPEPDRLSYLAWAWTNGGATGSLTPYAFAFVREHAASFEAVATFATFEGELDDPDRFTLVRGLRVSEDFFRATGRVPSLGRPFTAEEVGPGGVEAAVLSDGFWRREFGGDPAAIGRELRIEGVAHRVVGVLPRDFRFPSAPEHLEVLLPLRLRPDPLDEGLNYTVLARLRPGVGRDRAEGDLERVSAALAAAHPDVGTYRSGRVRQASYQDLYVGDLRRSLLILLGAVGFVLLVACANVANLLLARAAARDREIAIRAAIGASRGRLRRQLLTEGLLLSLIAGAIGLVLALVALKGMLGLVPQSIPRSDEIGLDWRVLGFTFLVAASTGVGFGLVAAQPVSRGDPAGGLRSGARVAPSRRRAHGVLIVAETALAVVLLAGAALLIASFARLRAVDPGFDPDGVAAVRFGRLPQAYNDADRRVAYEIGLLERIRALPGVESAAALSSFPFERGLNIPVTVRPDAAEGAVELRSISPRTFETLRVPILRGRTLAEADGRGGPRVAIINDAMARRYWPDGDPIGQRIEIGRWEGRWLGPAFEGAFEIVGIAGDVREIGLAQPPRRTVYVTRSQLPIDGPPRLVVRGADAASLRTAIVAAAQEVDPLVPAPEVVPLGDVLGASLAPQRFQTLVLAIFAASALLLTAIGIYGVVAYTVRQQVREIGIRMVLGAQAGQLLRHVMARGMALIAAGVALGIVSALGLTRFLSGVLYGIAPTDPRAFTAAVGLLAAIALLAIYIPARRATRVPPTVALAAD